MTNLRRLLEDADPLRVEAALPASEARAIRRAMLAAADSMPPVFFPRALPVAALVVVMIVAGAAAGRRLSLREPLPSVAVGEQIETHGERRQVQFATPGGTRIIWTIDPNFQLEVMP